MGKILIIEGVTGAGKTSVISALRSLLPPATIYIAEEETLGNIMNDLKDKRWREQPTFNALERVLKKVQEYYTSNPTINIVLERFHFTTYMMLPNIRTNFISS